MTAAKLKELEARATEGPWEISEHTADGLLSVWAPALDDDGLEDPIEIVTDQIIPENALLVAYLRNHAQDFIRLMEAASAVLHAPDDDADVKAYYELDNALAAFKEKS